MLSRLKPWHLVVIVVLLCGAAAFAVRALEAQCPFRTFDAAALIACLPPDRSTHVYLDVAALRESGILDLIAGSKAVEEPEQFTVNCVSANGIRLPHGPGRGSGRISERRYLFLVLRGRFDWKQLRSIRPIAGRHSAVNAVCEMPASTPDRHISFYPLTSDVMALAVAKQERAVTMVGPNQWSKPPQVPPEPVWIDAPAFTFEDAKNLPAGTQSFLRPLAQAQKIVFAIGPDGQRLHLRLEVACASREAADDLAAKLTSVTDELNKMLARDHMTPNPLDWSGVLTSGKFEQKVSSACDRRLADRARIYFRSGERQDRLKKGTVPFFNTR